MRALTLQSPWPFAVACLGKDIENRPWKPTDRTLPVGAMFALHGGKTPSFAVQSMRFGHFYEELLRVGPEAVRRYETSYYDIEGVFALARFGGIVTRSDSPWFCGPFGWLLTDVVVLPEPIPCRGAQGLWTLPVPVRRAVGEFTLAAAAARRPCP